MSTTLSNLKPAVGSRTNCKRLGRGNGSGKGNYSGKGIKGQRARTGGRKGLQRIGMKMIIRRIPKHRGFKSIQPRPAVVNINVLEKFFTAGDVITPRSLQKLGLVKAGQPDVKILSTGTLTKPLIIKGCLLSKAARDKIEKAGGKVI